MSHFSTALEAAIERDGRAKQDIAARLGMNQSQFSRYCSGRGSVGGAVVEKIVAEFPEADQARLWKGFLLDEVPAKYQRLIAVDARTDELNEARPDGLDDLPEDVRSALRFIGSRCTQLPVRAMILNFARILRGEPAAPGVVSVGATTPTPALDSARARQAALEADAARGTAPAVPSPPPPPSAP